VNLIEFWDPQGFANSQGKGGKGLGSSGGKKGNGNGNFSVYVAFALCQGEVSFTGAVHGFGGWNRIWANGSVSFINLVSINVYTGADGQAPDPVFVSKDTNTPVLGYSGTAYATGTPIQLGSSPALPNFSVEVAGPGVGTVGATYPDDANPSFIVTDLLTNTRYGAGFPSGNLDIAGSIADFGTYCQAAQLAMSLILDRSQPCARWIEEIAQLTSCAVVWSGSLLKIIPYGDSTLNANGATWTPDLTWQYSFTDDDYISFGPDSGPVIVTRSDPLVAPNWGSVEYMDSGGNYNPQVVPVFDQGLIDVLGQHTEPPVQAHEFTNPTSAGISGQLLLQRKNYILNTYKFKVGWRFSLLEPMDIVLLSDTTLGLSGASVRVIQIEEDDNGELTITAEEIPGLTP
jgi:hypothetical protein